MGEAEKSGAEKMKYADFIKGKTKSRLSQGIEVEESELNPHLYPFQRQIVRWALKKGKAAIFADCGLGKTISQLSWAAKIPGDVLLLAPIAVAEQTKTEGERFGIPTTIVESAAEVVPGINITNYEKLHKFDLQRFHGVVLDESSILKNVDGKTRKAIIEGFAHTPFKLACSATPAPNDFMELGNHAEFFNLCSFSEMLAEYFVHDGGETQKWRLKGHAIKPFWRWVSSWAVTIAKPSDLGYPDEGFALPPLDIVQMSIAAQYEEVGYLFPMMASSLSERQSARRKTISPRAEAIAEVCNRESDRCHLVWCNLNNEADEIRKRIPDAVEIRGSDSPTVKRDRMIAFTNGKIRVLVTKGSIAGFGMNWQHCSSVFYCGLSDSYEEFYQTVRRVWRYGQKNPVRATVVISDTEGAVVANIKRKDADAKKMTAEMVQLYKEVTNGLAY